jgi:integrase
MVTPALIARWLGSMEQAASSRIKALVLMHGIFQRAKKGWGLQANPAAEVERPPLSRSGATEVFSPEEVWALVRAAGSEQDGAIFLTAAFTGLRMGELLALRWRDLDFAGQTIRVRRSYYAGQLTTPKSGKVRAVPLASDVGSMLAQLGRRQDWVGEDDLEFVGHVGGYVDGSTLRRRYKAALAVAGLRGLRFHDLRHTFGSRMIAKADIRRVQEWMGHADIQTTMRYLHYAPRSEDAELVAEAFRVEPADSELRDVVVIGAGRSRVETVMTIANAYDDVTTIERSGLGVGGHGERDRVGWGSLSARARTRHRARTLDRLPPCPRASSSVVRLAQPVSDRA